MTPLTRAGETALRVMRQLEMFEDLKRRDPTAEQYLLPWDGRSPRDLTEARKRFILGNEGREPNEDDARIDEQCRRHHYGS